MSPSSPKRSDAARTGILHEVRGETPGEARIAVLRLAQVAAERGDLCVLASSAEPAVLTDLAKRIGFDLAGAAQGGRFQLLRTPAALIGDRLPDGVRSQALSALAAQVCTRRPALFAIDDPETLGRFETPGAFEAALNSLHAELAAHAIPLVLATVGAPPARRPAARRPPARPTHSDSPSPPAPADFSPETQGDGAALPDSGIEYIDLQAPHPAAPASDPFVINSGGARSLKRGHFVSSEMDVVPSRRDDPPSPHTSAYRATTADALLETDLFEHIDIVSTLDAFDMKPGPEPLSVPDLPAPDPRLVFIEALDEAMASHEATARPFLAVALRMPPEHSSARRFHIVLSAVEHVLGDRAVLLADEERCRAAWMVPDATPEMAPPFFAAMKRLLRDATSETNLILQSASVALVPNGRPFPNAEAFLAGVFHSES